jgi:hypothetical protein
MAGERRNVRLAYVWTGKRKRRSLAVQVRRMSQGPHSGHCRSAADQQVRDGLVRGGLPDTYYRCLNKYRRIKAPQVVHADNTAEIRTKDEPDVKSNRYEVEKSK